VAQAEAQWRRLAEQASRARQKAAPDLAQRVSAAMQQLGMAGGRFEVALLPQDAPQSFGLEGVEFLVAGHAGSARARWPRWPRAVSSRLALAIAVTTAQQRGRGPATALHPGTLIFDEIDSGVGGTVADAVGRLMKQLGQSVQVLSVTHLPQVAACADHHFVVAKATRQGQTQSQVSPVEGEARVAEVARMLGGASGTSLAHAQQLIQQAALPHARPPRPHDEHPTPLQTDARPRRARSAWWPWSPASRVRASRWPCMRWRTPASSAWTTCPRAAARAGACGSRPRRAAPGRGGGRAHRQLAAGPAAAAGRAGRRRRQGAQPLPGRQHPGPGQALLRNPSPAPAVPPGVGSDRQRLVDAIEQERQLLAALRERSTVMDTSELRPAQLRLWIRDLVGASRSQLTLVFQSFAFKHGVPLDADMVFDVRVLPNPSTCASCAR
jgi:hypothetical protein